MRSLLIAAVAALVLTGCASGLAEGMAAGDTRPPAEIAPASPPSQEALSAAAVAVQQATRAATDATYERALNSSVRTTEDQERDDARHTAEALHFAQVHPGQKVIDMIMGGGFWTRLFSAAVESDGHVTAWQPAEFIGFQASYGEAPTAAEALPNVDAIRSPIGAPEFPQGVDLIFTNQNYHDLHLQPFAATTAAEVNARAFAALKPGGLYVIIDHNAAPGSGLEAAHAIHRIDPAIVIEEVTAAGFVLDGRSDVLENAADPLTASVFDESIRGRTSQFMLRFRKPG